MRAICKLCNDSCSYLKRGTEGDCVDLQVTNIGYKEAVEKAAKWIESNIEQLIFDDMSMEEILTKFKQSMEL